ncbi:hypothetical protein SEA_PEGGYLEG03_64 [Arthrobacter phage PeggyLeg03]|nr:hypothetical protein SEA_PEGGYLEG03_64 [Arthrobacter phage PeggyLeg03]
MNKQDRTKTHDALDGLLNVGDRYELGGNGKPVGLVLIYENQAFINASWGGEPEDRLKALVDAAAAEGMKDK